ncbi:Polyamine transporter 3 [Wickerhamomyces ciferrii]|uniref:Polyamine transporter 3 n=1 Tax=Wickerhamomyces ciferrii (strain ATCC 14091 / BCRC 22168 / CBS 111 / JCM 3599 / NBRC 0793 / NRRL Y-1031 F-60-10) TaxID=1206466 RepID=K0KHB6_WICCF|nr:Polyamine transporter 3 [Wickerhamomyces ciferrii]CCH41572.1 Polyamine transporter 3 [Wickerhamomyces ciferrii]
MATPLDTLDLPDIDEQLSNSEQYEDAKEANTYEQSPYKESNNNEDHRDKEESLQELEKSITKDHIPRHDVVNPSGHEENAFFPEEYQVETETGLVRSTTALSLQRSRSRVQPMQSGDDNSKPAEPINTTGLTKEKLDKAVERNRKSLEKNKNGKGFFHKLKSIFN